MVIVSYQQAPTSGKSVQSVCVRGVLVCVLDNNRGIKHKQQLTVCVGDHFIIIDHAQNLIPPPHSAVIICHCGAAFSLFSHATIK
jgi:acetone carboxylase gamma subunit